MNIPFHAPDRFYKKYKSHINASFERICDSGQFFDPSIIQDFEKTLADYCNRKYAVSVGSCTDALTFSLLALGIKPDDKVIVPAVSFIASVSPIVQIGAVPVFCDINPQSGLADFDHIKELINL